MGWGQPHTAPAIGTGTTSQIETAAAALRAVGIDPENLALGAIEAAGVIGRLREEAARVVRQENTAHGARP